MRHRALLVGVTAVCLVACQPDLSSADQSPVEPTTDANSMDLARLDTLVKRIDAEASQPRPGIWQFRIQDHDVAIFTDAQADRMRIVLPITQSDGLPSDRLLRLLQANYDSALDARYAVAQGMVWSVFIHPLADLTTHEFFSGVGQVVNIAESYGESFSSGMLMFGGGDTAARQRELLDKLLELEQPDSI